MMRFLICASALLVGCGASFTRKFNLTVAAYQAVDESVTTWYVAQDRKCGRELASYDTCMHYADIAVDSVDALFFALQAARDKRSLEGVCAGVTAAIESLDGKIPKVVSQSVRALRSVVCQ